MKTKKLKEKSHYNIGLFDYDIHIVFTLEDFNKIDKHHMKEQYREIGNCGGVSRTYFKENGQFSMLGVFDGRQSTIVHECVHIAIFILNYVGHEITEFDEVMPYLTDSLFREVNRRMELENGN